MLLTLALILCLTIAAAGYCAVRLTRPVKRPLVAEVSPVKATLERRLREGADFTI